MTPRIPLLSLLLLALPLPASAQPLPSPSPSPPPPPSPSPSPPPPPLCPTPPLLALLPPTLSPGLSAPVAATVSSALRTAVTSLGYALPPPDTLAAAVRDLPPTQPPTPTDLLRVAQRTSAQHALTASIGAAGGAYLVVLPIANADGTGPWVLRGSFSAADLARGVSDLVRSALPPAAPIPCPAPAPPPATPSQLPPRRPLRLALQTEAAVGVWGGSFYNHLAGARLDYRFTPSTAFGASFAYANLKGKDGRASNVLGAIGLDQRIRLGHDGRWMIPLRFAGGYLPNNGPTLRLASGVAYELGDGLEVVLDLVAPTFWITHDTTVASMDFAVEIAFAL